MTDSNKAYHAQFADDQYLVQSTSGRVIMSCRDQSSAEHYAVLLCEAYKTGFKNGYQKAKSE